MASPSKPIKRHRDPLSPKPILDRVLLLKALKSNGISLKNGQLDLFYQLLHRSGYPPLREFAAELRGQSIANPENVDDSCSVSVNGSVSNSSNNQKKFVQNSRTRNPISSRPGKKPQLPKAFLEFLAKTSNESDGPENNVDRFTTLTSKVQMHKTSADGTTTKLAVELQDGHVVESVLMRHEGRATLCVSSQVGCAMGCTFCATGTMGIRGNLCSGEILEQLVHASRILATSHLGEKRASEIDLSSVENELENKENVQETKFDERSDVTDSTQPRTNSRKKRQKQKRLDLIRNIVFMGMGEPLNNYANVLAACRAMIDRRLWNLAHNRVTVSTVGVTSRMRDLTRDLPEVNLALSLHAPNQVMREKIVPAAKGTPIESLIEALDAHMMAFSKRKIAEHSEEGDQDSNFASGTEFNLEQRQTASKKKRAMIEYVMLVGDSSTIEAAHQLGKLCEGRHLVVNLIPYNKTDVQDKLSCPSEEHMLEFQRIVASYGSFCTIRRTMGADIAGACGQLVVEEEKKQQKILDIEDGPFRKDTLEKPTVASLSKRGKKKHDMDGKDSGNETPKALSQSETSIDVDPWMRCLTIATAVTAIAFVASSALLILQRRKR